MYKLSNIKGDLTKLLKSLPKKPGVYRFLNEDQSPVYIGKAKNLRNRVTQYFQNLSNKTEKLRNLADEAKYLELTLTNTELEALLLEQHLIKEFKPKFNVQFKDDKGYPWLRINVSKEYPGAKSFLGKKDNKEEYFGPYPSSYAAREALSLIQKTFKLRNCSDSFFSNRSRPCIQYEIGRCSAPCVGYVSKNEYLKDVNNAKKLLEGKAEDLIEDFYSLMDANSDSQHYEKALVYRDKISALRDIQRNQSITGFKKERDAVSILYINGVSKVGITHVNKGWITSHQNFSQKNKGINKSLLKIFLKNHYFSGIYCPPFIIVEEAIPDKENIELALSEFHKKIVKIITKPGKKDQGLLEISKSNTRLSIKGSSLEKRDISPTLSLLKSSLGLKKEIKILESYDISHHSGKGAVGSCVVYSSKGNMKENYRLFNISKKNSANDTASMQEVIKRRFTSKSLNLSKPSHILIDGGKTHLKAVNKILRDINIDGVELISISKGARRKAEMDSIHLEDGSTIRVGKESSPYLFLQEVRDETHRFAINNQKKKQLKLSLQSSLDQAYGVGEVKRSLLLRYFGSMEQIERASIQDLVNVPMIGLKTAKLVYNHLH
jgi:excinuclease ABC subunit C